MSAEIDYGALVGRGYHHPIDDLDAAAARAAIAASFAQVGIELPLGEIADETPHLLVEWADDYDMSAKVVALPHDAFSDQLRDAFAHGHREGYAFDDLMDGDARSEALLRIDVAMGQADYEDTLEDVDPDLAERIPEDERDCLEGYVAAVLEHGKAPVFSEGAFDKRFIAFYRMRRSQ